MHLKEKPYVLSDVSIREGALRSTSEIVWLRSPVEVVTEALGERSVVSSVTTLNVEVNTIFALSVCAHIATHQ